MVITFAKTDEGWRIMQIFPYATVDTSIEMRPALGLATSDNAQHWKVHISDGVSLLPYDRSGPS